ncbi:MAG: SIS domain-containing protein [Bacteroidetes bacterium]|nr:SIS domain-containing protein [Bacteroidota bacterium]MBU1717684.1 SIS domain-containing protein [Bacteroidota bacterium]
MENSIIRLFSVATRLHHDMEADQQLHHDVEAAFQTIVAAFRSENRVLFCGNGGSAADAQHIASELSGRFKKDRDPLDAEALHVNSSYMTAVANDYSFDNVYERLVRAKGRKNDVLVAISTSGNSGNILRAVAAAKAKGLFVVGLSGKSGGKLKALCDICICIPAEDTPRVQEGHILVGHILCELIENELFA